MISYLLVVEQHRTHCKFLMGALKENIERYEKQFGEIKLHGGPPQQGGQFGFRAGGEPEAK